MSRQRTRQPASFACSRATSEAAASGVSPKACAATHPTQGTRSPKDGGGPGAVRDCLTGTSGSSIYYALLGHWSKPIIDPDPLARARVEISLIRLRKAVADAGIGD